MFGYQGAKLIYDPLEIMIDTAHKYDLSIEAWINPYRVSQRNDFSLLAKNNIALKWQNTSKLIVLDNGIYFNPCYNEVTDLIVKGVKVKFCQTIMLIPCALTIIFIRLRTKASTKKNIQNIKVTGEN